MIKVPDALSELHEMLSKFPDVEILAPNNIGFGFSCKITTPKGGVYQGEISFNTLGKNKNVYVSTDFSEDDYDRCTWTARDNEEWLNKNKNYDLSVHWGTFYGLLSLHTNAVPYTESDVRAGVDLIARIMDEMIPVFQGDKKARQALTTATRHMMKGT